MPGQADGLAGTSQGAPRPAFRPSPAAGTPPRRNCVPGNRVPPLQFRKPLAVSHLDLDAAGCETASPVSWETALHVGVTSGRGGVTAHARPRARGGSGKLALGSGRRARLTLSAQEAGRRGGLRGAGSGPSPASWVGSLRASTSHPGPRPAGRTRRSLLLGGKGGAMPVEVKGVQGPRWSLSAAEAS